MGRIVEIPAPIGTASLHIVEGEVLHRQDETRTEVTTHTQSSGGRERSHNPVYDGYIQVFGRDPSIPRGHPIYGTYVEPVTTTTRTTVKQRRQHRLWVAERDGTRHELLLKEHQCDFAAAVGHRLRLVTGGASGGAERTPLWARNLTLGQAIAFEEGDLWGWSTMHGLARYPLLYRMVFRWAPWLLAAYVLFYWTPVTEWWHRVHAKVQLHSLADFVQLNLAGLKQWSPWLVYQTYAARGFEGWFIFGFGLLCGLLLWVVCEMVGYLAIGWWWRRLWQAPFRNRVVAAYES